MANSSSHGPAHYKYGSIEVWDFIRDQELSYHLGCAVKYICRAGRKPIDGQSLSYAYIKDLTKAIHYLQNELENEIGTVQTGTAVQAGVSHPKQQDPPLTMYTEDLDR